MTPAGQRWTRKRPKHSGWYWWRANPGGYAIIERYDMSADGLVMYKQEAGQLIKYPLLDGEWQGPLTPNEATA